jgi:protein-tyrosine phosphatase
MIKVLFICHGNICRSPMAEYIMKNMLESERLTWAISCDSAATSMEEIGHDMYPPAKRKLSEEGIPFEKRRARQITRSDYEKYDYLILMERYNIRNALRIFREDPENKLTLMKDYTGEGGDIADPWYTGDFDLTYKELDRGIRALIEHIKTHDL